MSETPEHVHREAGTKIFLWVWFWLLALTGIEVFLGYEHLAVKVMLTLLMGLSTVKAALIIAYFMHLRYERASLALSLVPALIIVILLMCIMVFPDSFRLLQMRPR